MIAVTELRVTEYMLGLKIVQLKKNKTLSWFMMLWS